MTKYATNVSQANIGITALKLQLPVGGWVKLSNEDAKHAEVEEAVRRGWIKIELTEPAPAVPFKSNIEFSVPQVHGSKTIPVKAKKEAA